MNIRWANTIEITNKEAEFFLEKQKNLQSLHIMILEISDQLKDWLASYVKKL